MQTFDLNPLADRIGCVPELEAADGKDLSRVGWQFLAAILREIPVKNAKVKAIVNPVIAGMDRLACDQDWPEAWEAGAAAQVAWTAWAWAARDAVSTAREAAAAASVFAWASWAAASAARAAEAAKDAGLSYDRQREILLKLIQEAPDANL